MGALLNPDGFEIDYEEEDAEPQTQEKPWDLTTVAQPTQTIENKTNPVANHFGQLMAEEVNDTHAILQ